MFFHSVLETVFCLQKPFYSPCDRERYPERVRTDTCKKRKSEPERKASTTAPQDRLSKKRKAFPKKGKCEWEKPEGIQTGLIPGMSAGLQVRGGPKGTKPPRRLSQLPSEPQNAPDFDPSLCTGSRWPCGNTPQVGEGPSNLHESSSPWQGPCCGRRLTLIL